jgi:hypothetical protein
MAADGDCPALGRETGQDRGSLHHPRSKGAVIPPEARQANGAWSNRDSAGAEIGRRHAQRSGREIEQLPDIVPVSCMGEDQEGAWLA